MRDKIYFPVDPADVFRVPEAPRRVPRFLEEAAKKDVRAAWSVIAAALLIALGAAIGGRGWMKLAVPLPALGVLAFGAWRLKLARQLPNVFRDGELVLARVWLELGTGLTEIRYAERERDVTTSGDVGVFAGDPGRVRVTLDYEYAGVVHHVSRQLEEGGKPVAVRIGGKLGCAVLVHPRNPGLALLVTQRLARGTLDLRVA